jgi:tetratricopeptide (TPR) repeat protein
LDSTDDRPKKNNKMKFHQIADSAIATTRSRRLEFTFSIFRALIKLYLSVCVFCTWTVAAMGSGGGGGGGPAVNSPLQKEVGSSAFKVYNQGVDLIRAKKFAAAQIKFEQAIRDNPNFAEAHNNVGFTLRQQGPQNYSKALEHYSKAIQLKPRMAETYEYGGCSLQKWAERPTHKKTLLLLES